MGIVYNFEDLVIWKMSKDVVKSIYQYSKEINDFGFRDQIQRAAVSIMNNISEGFQRNKFSKDHKQFLNFLNISYGSCAEVRNMLYLAEEINYISTDVSKELRNRIIEIECKIEALVNKLQKSSKPTTT